MEFSWYRGLVGQWPSRAKSEISDSGSHPRHGRQTTRDGREGSSWSEGSCGQRVLRGGSWNYGPDYARVAFRASNDGDLRRNIIGFRLTKTD